MTARIIDGKAIAETIRGEIAAQVAEFRQATNCIPHLAAILVGDDPASGVYVRGKQRACEKVGLKSSLHRLPDTTSEDWPTGTCEPAVIICHLDNAPWTASYDPLTEQAKFSSP